MAKGGGGVTAGGGAGGAAGASAGRGPAAARRGQRQGDGEGGRGDDVGVAGRAGDVGVPVHRVGRTDRLGELGDLLPADLVDGRGRGAAPDGGRSGRQAP